jgi:hypothetical protein
MLRVLDPLRRWKAASAAAVLVALTLAASAGTSVTMFSIMDHVMLRPLAHVLQPERLVSVDAVRDYSPYLTLREKIGSMDVAAYWPQTLSLNRGPGAVPVSAEFVSYNYFDVLGAQPALGRWFDENEETAGRLSAVVVLSDRLWKSRFQADASIIGRPVWITNAEYTVIGVAPGGFTGALADRVDLWLPFSRNTAIGSFNIMQPGSAWHYTFGRLRENFTLEEALAEGATLAQSGALGVVEEFTLQPLADIRTRNTSAGDRTLIVVLNVAGGIILLLACVNAAGLLRSSNWRTIASMAAVSAIGAAFFVFWAAPLVRDFFMSAAEAGDFFDARTAAATVGFALVAAILSGVLPAFPGWRGLIAVSQIALTFVLLVGAGLFLRSVQQVRALPWGYDADSVFLLMPNLAAAGRSPQEANAIYQRMHERVQSQPNVERATVDVSLPFGSGVAGGLVPVDSTSTSRNVVPFVHIVTPDYLEVLGAKLVAGRNIGPEDTAAAPPVLMISQRTALEYWSGQSALGQCFLAFRTGQCFEVVGVVENTRWRVQGGASPPEVFVPLAQAPTAFPSASIRCLLIRISGGPGDAEQVVSDLRDLEPDLPYMTAIPLWSLLDSQTRPWRLGATVFGFFALIALLISGAGVAGVRFLYVVIGWIAGLAVSLASGRYVERLLFDVSPTDAGVLTLASVVILVIAIPFTALRSSTERTATLERDFRVYPR